MERFPIILGQGCLEGHASLREISVYSRKYNILMPSKIHFFAHLTVARLISEDSMLSLLRSFTAVLDEFGVSYGRAKQAALCAGEGLLIVGRSSFLKGSDPDLFQLRLGQHSRNIRPQGSKK